MSCSDVAKCRLKSTHTVPSFGDLREYCGLWIKEPGFTVVGIVHEK